MTLGSLFDGISGFPLAASWCGIETKWISEIDPYCLKVSKKNFPNAIQYGDIKELYNAEPVDIISGGFPCQPFSVAGKRRGKEDNRYLWPEMFRVIRETKPRWVIGENVPGILRMGLEDVLSDLESEGYKPETFIIPACAINAPHRRDRVWIIAYSERIGLSRGIRQEARLGLEAKILFSQKTWKEIPPPYVCGADDGIPNRMDRIKALGNAIVPQVAYEIFKAILEIESRINN